MIEGCVDPVNLVHSSGVHARSEVLHSMYPSTRTQVASLRRHICNVLINATSQTSFFQKPDRDELRQVQPDRVQHASLTKSSNFSLDSSAQELVYRAFRRSAAEVMTLHIHADTSD